MVTKDLNMTTFMSDEKTPKGEGTEAENELDELDLDAIDLDPEEDDEDDDETDPAPEEVETDPKKEAETTANIQRKKWRDRAKAAEAELARLKAKNPSKPASKKVEADPLKQDRIDFRFDHPELSSLEVNEIEALARAKNVSMEDAMKSPLVQVFLKVSARKREHAQASPESRHTSAPRPKIRDPKDMTNEEFEAFKRQVKSGAYKK